MLLYSSALLLALVLGSPWWLARMLTSGRYRKGLGQRLGSVPEALKTVIAGRRVVWVHAVSVGEVLAATRLIAELEKRLGEGWKLVVSTTTATGQTLARQRFGAERVFFYPFDFGWTVRAYLDALQPRLLVLMESELWPRMLVECEQRRIPVAVVNARKSDRSFARGMRVRPLWKHALQRVSLWLAQSDEDAHRLTVMGAKPETVRVAGNLKYDIRAPQESRIASLLREAVRGRPVIVAGSTCEGKPHNEEECVMQAMDEVWTRWPETLLILAPRHPERFDYAASLALEHGVIRATSLLQGEHVPGDARQTIVLNTIGDLAAVYALANAAFVGGSLVERGGHNPLEPAQFGVPVVMGPSYENFREIVETMRAKDALLITQPDQLGAILLGMLADPAAAKAVGERGQQVYTSRSGATERTVQALLELVQ